MIRLRAWALAGIVSIAPSGARAEQGDEQCARAAERAQVLRENGKLQDAARELRTCLRATCPEIIRRDCAQWQADVEASTPTVILGARTAAGADVLDARARVDGAPFVDRLDGIERPLDPGLHRIQFEAASGGTVEIDVVLREGEKRRPIVVGFATAPSSPPPTASLRGARSTTVAAWTLTGLGAASLVAVVPLTVTGIDDLRAMRNGCGRTASCASSEVAGVRSRLWLADGLLALGVASEAIAGWLWLRPGARVAAGLSLGPTGTRVSFEARF